MYMDANSPCLTFADYHEEWTIHANPIDSIFLTISRNALIIGCTMFLFVYVFL